ncbi:MAG: hypothetical protein AB1505_16245 [Candidatus Latescibacterota bacterium]
MYGEILQIGEEKQLFVDDWIVDDAWAAPRVVHQGVRYPGNPILEADQPWEGIRVCFPEVHRRADGWWQMWYVGHQFEAEAGSGRPWATYGIGYAVSEDGLRWEKPELKVVDYAGVPARNLVVGHEHRNDRGEWIASQHGPQGLFLVHGGGPATGDGLLHAVTKATPADLAEAHPKGGLCHVVSGDGIHWYRAPSRFLLITGHSDCMNQVVWNPERSRYVAYLRPPVFAGPAKRRMSYSESSDMVEWTQPVVALFPDEADPPGRDIDRFRIFRSGRLWLGFLALFDHASWTDTMHSELIYSRNGLRWERFPRRVPILGRGAPGAFDETYAVLTTPPFARDGRLWAYYDGWGGDSRTPRPPGPPAAIGCVSWRQDGLVSRRHQPEGFAWGGPGEILTRTLLCPGGRLYVNYQSVREGSLRVGVQAVDAQSGDQWRSAQWAAGYGYEQCCPLTGDETDATVRWEGQPSLDPFTGRPIRLRFQLDRAEIFAFQVRR